DQPLLESLRTVGSQLGQYIEHARTDVAARRSEALKAAVLEAALDCIVIMDHRGRVVEFNPAAVGVFGYERAEVIGREMAELIIPPALRARHRQGLARYLATGEGPVLGARFEITGMRADGSEFPVELAITPLEVDGAPLFTGYLRDITPRVQAEAERATLLERERLARLRAEHAEHRAAFLAGAGAALSSSLDPETTLERVAELTVPELADWCMVDIVTDGRPLRRVAVATSDEDKRELAFEIARRYPLDRAVEGGMAKALGRGEPELIAEVPTELLETLAQDTEHLRMLLEMGLVSAMFVPLTARGRTLGAMALGSADSGRRFGGEDLKTAEDLASRAATAIDNARLYKSRSDVARTLQRSLLPPVLPSIPGCEVAARYRPAGEANEVGGDFYDLFELGEGSWALAIGDVCGKGAEAAATTGLARHTLRAAAMRESRPSRMLAVLNEALLSQRRPEEFCTVALGSLAPSSAGMRLTLAGAGHPRPLVARADGSVEEVGLHGTALGVLTELEATDCAIELGRGDTIVFYTDGLLDAQAPEVIVGEREMISRLRSCQGLEPAACAEHLERAAVGGAAAEPRDDMAILVLTVKTRRGALEAGPDPLLELRLAGGPTAPAAARRELEALAGRLDPDMLRSAQLLLSELVTNSVTHGGASASDTVEVLVSLRSHALRVEVRDHGPGYERDPHVPDPDDLSGRGLFLVEQIADRYGQSQGEGGTWFELDLDRR
ncbi:MAG: SpoIIE family protein phosphatase, partial [Actinobacteria bacterium]|nr:SpoIIE family protein phosphatase [Actinomycetota bacterium]